MNVQSYIEKTQCCGCRACEIVCPANAISMHADWQGFLYPSVDENQCIACGLCVMICKRKTAYKKPPIGAYAAYHNNDAVRMKSSSGGICAAFYQYAIEGGACYGVAYNKEHSAVYERGVTASDCERFLGSKYTQADTGRTFAEVRRDIEEGIKVLYVGTSCHIAGLLSYLEAVRCDVSNLVTVDLICHGVPSPRLFGDFIAFLQRLPEFASFSFRTKYQGWQHCPTIFYKGGTWEINTARAWIFQRLCKAPHNLCYAQKDIMLSKW